MDCHIPTNYNAPKEETSEEIKKTKLRYYSIQPCKKAQTATSGDTRDNRYSSLSIEKKPKTPFFRVNTKNTKEKT